MTADRNTTNRSLPSAPTVIFIGVIFRKKVVVANNGIEPPTHGFSVVFYGVNRCTNGPPSLVGAGNVRRVSYVFPTLGSRDRRVIAQCACERSIGKSQIPYNDQRDRGSLMGRIPACRSKFTARWLGSSAFEKILRMSRPLVVATDSSTPISDCAPAKTPNGLGRPSCAGG